MSQPRAHHQGLTPLDWDELAATHNIAASPQAVNRALAHLADDGYIEGISTPSGWLDLCPTARGIAHAGRAGRRLPPSAVPAPPPSAVIHAGVPDATAHAPMAAPTVKLPLSGRETARKVLVSLSAADGRVARAVSPRLLAARTQMAHAWHIFTSFP